MDLDHFKQIRETADPSKFKLGRWANDDEVSILTSLAELYQLRNYFECGTANGWSAAHVSCAMGEGANLHSWDVVERAQVPSHYLDRVERHIASFETGVGAVLSQTRGRKLIFIDGDHTGGAPTRDFQAVEKFLRIGDFVVFHDTAGEAPVARAVEKVKEWHPRWRFVHHPTRRGVGVFEVY